MTTKIYVVTIRWVSTNLTKESVNKIDTILGSFGDWIRFSGYCWFVKTNSPANKIYEALASFLKTDDSELIMRVDPDDFSGWAAKWIDEWIKKK